MGTGGAVATGQLTSGIEAKGGVTTIRHCQIAVDGAQTPIDGTGAIWASELGTWTTWDCRTEICPTARHTTSIPTIYLSIIAEELWTVDTAVESRVVLPLCGTKNKFRVGVGIVEGAAALVHGRPTRSVTAHRGLPAA